jgi:large subunit ribosomal protein L4
MKAPLYSKEGKKKQEVVLNPEIFGARINRRLLQLVGTAYRRNLRHGTAKTKTRKEVRGGGKKPWKQKGTGRARHSSIRSPIWVGGGTARFSARSRAITRSTCRTRCAAPRWFRR